MKGENIKNQKKSLYIASKNRTFANVKMIVFVIQKNN